MRITERMVFRQSTQDISALRGKLFNLQQQAISGKRIGRVEDDPVAAERVRLVRSAREAAEHHQRNIVRSQTQLNSVDGALGEGTNILIRAKELALAMSNGTVGPEERAMVAAEAASLYESMLNVANTKVAGEYVFGGFSTETIPFLNDGTFVGNDGRKEVDVGSNARVVVNVSGRDAFTAAGGVDILAELDNLYQALNNNDVNGISNAVDFIDQAINQIVNVRTDAGLKLNQLDMAYKLNEKFNEDCLSQESQLIDSDAVEVFLNINATLQALEDAMTVSQKVTSISMLGN